MNDQKIIKIYLNKGIDTFKHIESLKKTIINKCYRKDESPIIFLRLDFEKFRPCRLCFINLKQLMCENCHYSGSSLVEINGWMYFKMTQKQYSRLKNVFFYESNFLSEEDLSSSEVKDNSSLFKSEYDFFSNMCGESEENIILGLDKKIQELTETKRCMKYFFDECKK